MVNTIATITPLDEVKNCLVKMGPQFELSLPKHIPPGRFIQVAQAALMTTPSLVQCDRMSLYAAFDQCAKDGLLPDGKESVIIPFAGKAKYMPCVAGICKKARNSGEIATIDAQCVYEKDEYSAWVDERGPHFKFVKARGDRGKPVLTFSYAICKDGSVFFEEMEEDQIDAIKKQALSKLRPDQIKNSPWSSAFEDEMKRKSALRRLGKYRLPNSADLVSVFERDDDPLDAPDDAETPTDTAKTTPTRLGAIIEAQAEPPAAPTMEQAVAMVKEAIPGATVVEPKSPKKSSSKPKPELVIVQGKIENLKVKSGEGEKGTWRRFAIVVGGKFYGTFDEKIGKKMEEAVDSHSEITMNVKERQQDGKKYNDIMTLDIVTQAEEGEPIPQQEIPI